MVNIPNKGLWRWYGKRPAYKLYNQWLTGELGRGGLPAEQEARIGALQGIAGSTQAAESAARRTSALGFGTNVPTGLNTALMTRTNLAAPYGVAELGAQAAGRKSMFETGQAWENLMQNRANFYTTLIGPWLQKQLAEQSAAISLAGMGGGA